MTQDLSRENRIGVFQVFSQKLVIERWDGNSPSNFLVCLMNRHYFCILEGLIERGPTTEGGSFTKSDDKDIYSYDSFSVPLLHILQIQHTTGRVKNINSTQFYPKPGQNEHAGLFS